MSSERQPSTDYVRAGAWTRSAPDGTAPHGRPDHIDDVADTFERPDSAAFWSADAAVAWPRAPRGWRSTDLFGGHRAAERRAG